jgi:hypothetical protein
MTTVTVSTEERGASGASHLNLRKLLLACGLLASLTWLGTDVFASLSYEGYRYPMDPISGLSATDAPTRSFVVPLDNLYAVLKIVFAVGVWVSAGQKRALRITAGLLFAFGLTDLAAYLFPWKPDEALWTFGNVMHGLLAGGLTVLLILMTIGFGANADGKGFRFYSYGTLLILIVVGALPLLAGVQLAGGQPPEWFGAGERINGYGYMLWMIGLAFVLMRGQSNAARQESTAQSAE